MLRALASLSLSCLLLVTAAACSLFGPPDAVVPPPAAVGSVDIVVDGTNATLRLSGLVAPLRAVEVDVRVAGGTATGVVGLADHDVVEAGLVRTAENPSGGPRDRFTLVVADTRRVPVGNGPLARLTVDDGAQVTLEAAAAVDASGIKRPITVVAR